MQQLPVDAVKRSSPSKPPLLTTNQVGGILARIAYAVGASGVMSNVDVVMLQDHIITLQDSLFDACTDRDAKSSMLARAEERISELTTELMVYRTATGF